MQPHRVRAHRVEEVLRMADDDRVGDDDRVADDDSERRQGGR